MPKGAAVRPHRRSRRTRAARDKPHAHAGAGSAVPLRDYGVRGPLGCQGLERPGAPAGSHPLRGDLSPSTLSRFGTEEQKVENCGPDGFKPGTAPLTSSWFSPHEGLTFPNLAIVTYYGAGLRAIDISNPFILREVGHFINKPVETVRWASYGITGESLPFGAAPGQVRMRPTVGRPMVFAFSYVLSHNGYLIYSDVHSGLYILKYTGPRKEEIPQEGICLTGNPGGCRTRL